MPLLRNIRSSAVATGLSLGAPATTLGNKGGVGVAFDVGATSCIFVNSHLAAHQENVHERNEDFFQIQQGLVRSLAPHAPRKSGPRLASDAESPIPAAAYCNEPHNVHAPRAAVDQASCGTMECSVDVNAYGELPIPDSSESLSPPLTPHLVWRRHHGVQGGNACATATLPDVFDRVVWAGDLNYRIKAPRAVVDQLLTEDMHEVLVENDQLLLERRRHRAFAGYQEGPLNFRPTYKFDAESDVYDTSAKRRIPSWTDRILYASCSEANENRSRKGLQLNAYLSLPELRSSDHRPVLASFVLHFRESGTDGDVSQVVTDVTLSEVCSIM